MWRVLGVHANTWERPRGLRDVHRLAQQLLFAARLLVLALVTLNAAVGCYFAAAPLERFASPAYGVVRDTPGGVRSWGALLLLFAAALFAAHWWRLLRLLRLLLFAGCAPYACLAVALLVPAVRDPAAGGLGVVLMSFLAAVHTIAGLMVVPPEGR